MRGIGSNPTLDCCHLLDMNTNPVRSCLILFFALLVGSATASAQPTIKRIDRVELLSIEYEKGEIVRVISTKSLERREAQSVFSIWKQQKLQGSSPSACHVPAYALQFYLNGKLVMFATICWGCRNIDFITPRHKLWVRFQSDSKAGQRLKRIFVEAFPNDQKVISRVVLRADAP